MRWTRQIKTGELRLHQATEHTQSLTAIHLPLSDLASEAGRWDGRQAGLDHAVSQLGKPSHPSSGARAFTSGMVQSWEEWQGSNLQEKQVFYR